MFGLGQGLNPFRAGRCLSTNVAEGLESYAVSIPFEQGDVFRQAKTLQLHAEIYKSQSLSSRAMSFDNTKTESLRLEAIKSQSLSSRAMSFDLENSDLNVQGVASQSLSSRAMSFDPFIH